MKTKFTNEYKAFKRKMVLRFSAAALSAISIVLLVYYLVWQERIGDWIVRFLSYMGLDKNEAFWFYHSNFRQNKSAFFAVAIVLIFLVLLRLLFMWFTRYLESINQGIDKLLADDNEPLKLLPEMEPMEMKLNSVKRTLWQRKQDSLLAEQRKNELVMCLAHDIRTPLTSVIGYLNLLEEAQGMPPEQQAKYLRITLDKANRLERMVNEFFEITRYNSQQISLSETSIDLYYMLVQIIDEHSPALSARGNTVVLDADEELHLLGDSEKLARVFNNLLKNAVAYSYPDTEILISAKKVEGIAVISFENRGKTIPAPQLKNIFQKFCRLDDARESYTGGTGLGLAIAREIVLLHGGTIEASSFEERIIFTVRLPKAS